jgi:predicted DCC family thiol-disulfide oxidoreductase YuxK
MSHLLLIDGRCGFCARSTAWFTGGRFRPRVLPGQQAGPLLDRYGVPAERLTRYVALVDEDTGRVRYGHDAVLTCLVRSGGVRGLLGRVVRALPLDRIAARVYDRVAANRHRMPGGTEACSVDLS